MESLIILLVVYLVGALVVLPIWTFVKFSRAQREHDELAYELDQLQREVHALRENLKQAAAPARESAPPPNAAAVSTAIPSVGAAVPAAVPVLPVSPAPVPAEVPIAAATPPPARAAAPQEPDAPPVIAAPVKPVAPVASATPAPPVAPPARMLPTIDWEQFMGAKLFAWLGGLALFLGVAFFVKYSFEHDLIPPEVRVALGFLLGAGLIVGGLRLDRARYRITCQTLIGAGVVSLYAVTFACNSIYHFAFFGPVPTFLLMVLITAAAFLLAVRLAAPVVAILGLLGGFLTPVLLSTGQDNPPGLFGYLALLDAGLVAVALRTGWRYLVPLSAAGTLVMLLAWAEKFLTVAKAPVAMTVALAFSALYFVALELARRRAANAREFTSTAAALPLAGLGFALFFLGMPAVAGNAPLFLGYVLALDAFLLALAWREETLPRLHFLGGMIAFALFALWSLTRVTPETLPWALAAYLVFAGLHTAFPLLLERRRPASSPAWWSQLFPPLTLVLMLLPLADLGPTPWLLWPAVLLVDGLAIGLALATASLTGIAAVLVLTFIVTGVSLIGGPADVPLEPALLLVLGGFAVFFFAATLWLTRRLGTQPAGSDSPPWLRALGGPRAQLPAFSSLLPFLLLVMVGARLAVPDPSLLFGLALLLTALTLGLARLLTAAWLPACALAGVAALEYTWHARHFAADAARGPLLWYAGFYAVFAVYPFVFARSFARATGPWAVAALAGVAQFPLVYRLLEAAGPPAVPGLIPAAFALAPLLSLVGVLRLSGADNPHRLNQLAWFGAVALLFITLVFPVQFERQWVTIAWALEGVALLWLFHRVPHRGLLGTGVVLLVVAFARLALNPAVLSYHARSDTPVLNWYLYAYGLVTLALFAGAALLRPPHDRVRGHSLPGLLRALGVVLAFLLVNIEIADAFTPAGASVLTFQFGGNFARDMSYTIAWALFALGLLGAGIWQQQRAARYAALGLLGVALLKLFLHDLARLEALYRIGALFAVAVIAILASFAYQRFLPGHEKTPPSP